MQLQAFRNLIEKCQSLRIKQQTHTARSKNNLLISYRDELKSPNSHSKFKRASTITEHSRPPRHQIRRLSYQHSLPSIGEEGGKDSVRDARKGVKRSDVRPNFLKFSNPPSEEGRSKRAVVVMKGEDLKKRPARFSAGEMSTTKGSVSSTEGLTASKRTSQTSSSSQLKRTAGRKSVPSQPTALSPLTSPPVQTSPRRVRKVKKTAKPAEKPTRNPPLSQLRDDSKFTSSEFQADVEDFDAVTPIEEKRAEDCKVIANEMATKSHATVTIAAEVHLESRERHKLDTKETSITSISSLILPPPPSPRPSSRSASPLSSPSLTVRPFPPFTPSPPPKIHSPHTSPLPTITPATPATGGDSYTNDCSSDLLIPRERSDSSPPPPSRGSPHDSSPCETETDTDTLLPQPTSSGSLPRGKALSPNSPTSSRRKLSSPSQGSGKSKGGSVFLNTAGLNEDSDC